MSIGEEAALEARKTLDEDRKKALNKAGCTFARIINELKSIAFSDIADYVSVDEGGALQAKDLDGISKRKRAAVRKIKEQTNIAESKDGETVFKTSKIEYEVYDKQTALQQLLKLHGAYPNEKLDIEASGEITVNIVKFSEPPQ